MTKVRVAVLPFMGVIFLSAAGAAPICAAEDREIRPEVLLGGGYPDIVELGVGAYLVDRLSVVGSFLAHVMPDFDEHGGGLSAALGLTLALIRAGGSRVLLGAAGGHTLFVIGGCTESNPPECIPGAAWLLRLGTGYGYSWEHVEMRILLSADLYWWDENSDRRRAAASGWEPALFTVQPGLALQLAWRP